MFINNHSYFSLRYGTVAPESILKMAQKKGIKTLALTDINNTPILSGNNIAAETTL